MTIVWGAVLASSGADGGLAHAALVEQLQARCIEREYLAVIHGAPVAGGTVDAATARQTVSGRGA